MTPTIALDMITLLHRAAWLPLVAPFRVTPSHLVLRRREAASKDALASAEATCRSPRSSFEALCRRQRAPQDEAGGWSRANLKAGLGITLSVRGLPDPLLHRIEQRREHDEEDQDPEANSLALGKIRFSRPAQKGGNVMGVIIQRRLGAVLVIDSAVGDRLWHRDLVAGIVQIPLEIVGLRIAGQDRVDVIGAHLLIFEARQRVDDEPRKAALELQRFSQQRHVRRRLAERRRGGLVIRIGLWARDVVRWRRGALENFALLVGLGVGDLIGGGERLNLVLAEARPVGIGERAERNAQGMAGAANLLVHLEPALKLSLVIDAEHPREAPALSGRVRLLSVALRDHGGHARKNKRRGSKGKRGKLD